MKLSTPQNELIEAHRLLRFQRAGLDNQRLVKVIRKHVDDDTAVMEIIDAVREWQTALVQIRSKRGPFWMKAGATKRPDPFIKIGGTKVMLPRFYKK